MKNTKITKHDKIIDIFELDCSENHEQLWKIIKNDKIIGIFVLVLAMFDVFLAKRCLIYSTNRTVDGHN